MNQRFVVSYQKKLKRLECDSIGGLQMVQNYINAFRKFVRNIKVYMPILFKKIYFHVFQVHITTSFTKSVAGHVRTISVLIDVVVFSFPTPALIFFL